MVKEACDCRILGNHDEYLFDASSILEHSTSTLISSTVEQCRDELSALQADFVKGFEHRTTVPLGGSRSLLLFHGPPSSNSCDLLADTLDQDLAHHLQTATVMAGGHTHIQMLRQHRSRLLVNPGRVGLPFERFVAW